MLSCNVCEGPLGFLGRLGNLFHFHCINCGLEHEYTLTEIEALGIEDEELELEESI